MSSKCQNYRNYHTVSFGKRVCFFEDDIQKRFAVFRIQNVTYNLNIYGTKAIIILKVEIRV